MRTIGVVLAVALIAALAVGKAWTRPAAGALQCQPAQPFRAAFPSWSPAGDSVAFSVPNAESAAVVRATPGTVRYTGLATSFDSAPTRIVWAPVGEMIAWQKRTGAISIAPQGRNTFERELVHAQFGTVTELGDWSPDARHLVFMRDGRIYTVDASTEEIRHIADGLRPTWSPDGREIAFVAGRNVGISPNRPVDLDVIRPDGSGQRQVVAGLPSIDTIAWSPDSSKLAFVGTVIGIVPREGGAVSYSKPAQSPLEWRPNGIFYNLQGPAPAGIHAMRLDPETGATTALTRLPTGFQGTFLSASADGRHAAYGLDVNDERVGVRIVDAFGRNDQPMLACHGGAHPDRIRGSRLNDIVRVRGGGLDRVSCGRGQDTVYADRRDFVATDCEHVVRG